jgi:hypothetical protein
MAGLPRLALAAGPAPDDSRQFVVALLAIYVWAVVCFCVALCVHELGHFVAVRKVGWTCVGLHMAWLHVAFQGERRQATWGRLSKPIGAVVCFPKNPDSARAAWVVAAGALADLVLGCGAYAVGLALAAVPGDHPWVRPAAIGLELGGMLSLLVAVWALIPARLPSGTLSDGLQLWLCWRRPVDYLTYLRLAEIDAPLYGLRPRDWPRDRLSYLGTDPSVAAWMAVKRFWAELDGGDVRAAAREIDAAWRGIGALQGLAFQRAVIAFETAMFFTRFVDDGESARAAFECGDATMRKCVTRNSAIIARLFVQGKIAEATMMAHTIVGRLKRNPMVPSVQESHLRDWYARILDPTIPTLTRDELVE